MIHDDFSTGLRPQWQSSQQGRGQVAVRDGRLHLSQPAHDDQHYHNAQISDYDTAYHFRLTPPLRLTVTASASTDSLQGTAGFGFWNHPFSPDSWRFRLPQALWFFFASPESDMSLAQGVSGHGWKAATFNARRAAFLALLPTAPIAVPLMSIPFFYQRLWSIGQAAIGVSERALDRALLKQKHRYRIEWLPQRATFFIDDQIVHVADRAIPRGALGFVAWLDNQYAVVTPQGQLAFGFVARTHPQTLHLHDLHIERIT